MKKFMKPFVRAGALLLLGLSCLTAFAQQKLPQPNPQPLPCGLTLVSDFESQCILPFDKDSIYNEEPQAIIACQENVVTYTASANTGTATVTSWTWEVVGGTFTSNNNTATVTWGTEPYGQITVTVITDSGTSCSITQNVRLIEKPEIYVTTIPAYVELPSGEKIIYVCKGETVEFFDHSSTSNTDIVGYYWESDETHLTASTPNFRIENVWHHEDIVHHRVYNNCGCYDEEEYIIKVMEGEILELSCYGTVCEDAVVTYTAMQPVCDQYSWYVEGGTIIQGQDQKEVTVHWNNPQNGYGIIGLDGNLCGEHACPAMLTKRIPIIEDGLTIEGQDLVCVDEAVIYSVPLYGSTEYNWDVQPTTGISIHEVNGANQKLIHFDQPGTYQITVSYECEFLECGKFTSKVLTVTVKPRLTITGNERICVNNSCSLSTSPNVSAQWTVLRMPDEQFIHSEQGSQLNYTFSQTGKYKITATNNTFCKPAVFILTVLDTPPAPTLDDLDINNPTRACLGSSILLNANPTNPDYSIVWIPECSSAMPDTANGNQVTITYDSTTVCGINVYTYDRILGCMSDSHYYHPVIAYEPLPDSLPDTLVVCPGSEVFFDSDQVPYEEGMTYRWAIEGGQFHASVQGDSITNPTVRIIVNNQNTPAEFNVTLTRSYCPGIDYVKVIHFIVKGTDTSSLAIESDDTICAGNYLSLEGLGCDTNSSYYWRINDDILTTNPINYYFGKSGTVNVRFFCNNFDVCNNENYLSVALKPITVRKNPQVETFAYNSGSNRVEIIPSTMNTPNYSFHWRYNGNPQNFNHNYLPFMGNGNYSCTIIDTYGCSNTYTFYVSDDPGAQCQNINITRYGSINYCNSTITLKANNGDGTASWRISIGDASIDSWIDPSTHRIVRFKLYELGSYVFTARCCNNPCYSGRYQFTLDFIPDFWIEKDCNRLIIHNNSQYLDGTKNVYLKINSNVISFPVSQSEYYVSVPSGTHTYNISLVGFGTNGNISNCLIDDVTITNGANFSVDLSSPWNTQTCDNTAMPLQLSVSLPTSQIKEVIWNFGDNSWVATDGTTVSHTYAYSTTPYHLTVKVYNEDGCYVEESFQIESAYDKLKGGRINESPAQPVCPNDPNKYLYFVDNTNISSPAGTYEWSYPVDYSPNYHIDHTGTYFLNLENNKHCKLETKKNVQFLNAPTAVISTSGDVYCAGEKIILYGAQSPDTNSYTFQWTVTYSFNGQTHTTPTNRPTNATNSFTPTDEGWYTIDLSISANGCPATTTKVIYVNPKPAAPTINFGSNACIDNPPVELSGTSAITSQINWSNGDVGPNAYYFTPGGGSAWYYDPNTGCKSKEARFHIEPQPDFDALLTGCYEKCESFFRYHPTLPVWGLSSGRESINWKWYLNNNNIANGTVYYPNYFLSLPLTTFGDYNLGLDYDNGNCGTLTSPTLTINYKDTCDCKDLDVKYKYKWYVKDCKIVYKVKVTVCNNSNLKGCVSNLEQLFGQPNVDLVYTDFTFTPLNPGDCYSFVMTLVASQFIPSSTMSFRIYDGCTNCTTDFSIDLMPEKFDCEMEMKMEHIDIIPELSSSVAGYYKILVNVAPAMNVLAFWSDPPMVIDYWYDGGAIVHSLGMIDMSVLSQLMADDEDVCFYAITCENDKLCFRKYCFPARKLYDMIEGTGVLHGMAKSTVNGNDSESDLLSSNPRLMPNPTTGDVNVIGTDAEVIEVLVMDMNGRKMATFDNTDQFNVSNLASGIYIVRVRTKSASDEPEIITYLKLIKK